MFTTKDGIPGMHETLKRVAVLREVIGYDNDLTLKCYMGWNVDIQIACCQNLSNTSRTGWKSRSLPTTSTVVPNSMPSTPIQFSVVSTDFPLWAVSRSWEKSLQRPAIRHKTRGGTTTAQDQRHRRSLPDPGRSARRPGARLSSQHVECELPDQRVFSRSRRGSWQRTVLLHLQGRLEVVNGYLQLDDNKHGLGISITDTHLKHFEIIE